MSRRHAAAASLTLFDGVAVVEPERLVAGVDEAGRGPLAGPVAVAAVVFDPARPRINGLDDSSSSPRPAASSCMTASSSAPWPGTWCWWTWTPSTA